jgi:hypothetical protein
VTSTGCCCVAAPGRGLAGPVCGFSGSVGASGGCGWDLFGELGADEGVDLVADRTDLFAGFAGGVGELVVGVARREDLVAWFEQTFGLCEVDEGRLARQTRTGLRDAAGCLAE